MAKRKADAADSTAAKPDKVARRGKWQQSEKWTKAAAKGPTLHLSSVKGRPAVVATCTDGKEKQAIAELLNLLNTESDKIYGEYKCQPKSNGTEAAAAGGTATSGVAAADAAADVAAAASNLSIEEEIRKEAEQVRAGDGENGRFSIAQTDTRGVIVVCCNDSNVDVCRVVSALFEDIRVRRKPRSRFLVRLSPLAATCHASFDELVKIARPLVEAALPQVDFSQDEPAIAAAPAVSAAARAGAAAAARASAGNPQAAAANGGMPPPSSSGKLKPGVQAMGAAEAAAAEAKAKAAAADAKARVTAAAKARREAPMVPGGLRFKVDLQRRGTGFERNPVVTALAEMAGKGHRVHLSSPEVTIIVEGVKSLCGVSVVRDFVETKGYNLRQLQAEYCEGAKKSSEAAAAT